MKRFFLIILLFFPSIVFGVDEVEIRIKDHKFIPEQLTLRLGEKYKLVIKNEDISAEEFESHDLRREKLVAGGRVIKIPIGPLNPGKYEFFGEFHPKTARGVIIIE